MDEGWHLDLEREGMYVTRAASFARAVNIVCNAGFRPTPEVLEPLYESLENGLIGLEILTLYVNRKNPGGEIVRSYLEGHLLITASCLIHLGQGEVYRQRYERSVWGRKILHKGYLEHLLQDIGAEQLILDIKRCFSFDAERV